MDLGSDADSEKKEHVQFEGRNFFENKNHQVVKVKNGNYCFDKRKRNFKVSKLSVPLPLQKYKI